MKNTKLKKKKKTHKKTPKKPQPFQLYKISQRSMLVKLELNLTICKETHKSQNSESFWNFNSRNAESHCCELKSTKG